MQVLIHFTLLSVQIGHGMFYLQSSSKLLGWLRYMAEKTTKGPMPKFLEIISGLSYTYQNIKFIFLYDSVIYDSSGIVLIYRLYEWFDNKTKLHFTDNRGWISRKFAEVKERNVQEGAGIQCAARVQVNVSFSFTFQT